jgi:hypothetical protein
MKETKGASMAKVADLIDDEYLEFTNELLADSSAEGAYAVGLVSALCWLEGRKPPFPLLEAAARATSVADAAALVRGSDEIRAAFSAEGGRRG